MSMTVKHIDNVGTESVIAVDAVSFHPKDGTVTYRAQGYDRDATVKDGRVYVMNAEGATVAKYQLTPSNLGQRPAGR